MGILRKSKPGEPLEYARHPLVYMVEAADDICYEIMDIEDSHKLKILSSRRQQTYCWDSLTRKHSRRFASEFWMRV